MISPTGRRKRFVFIKKYLSIPIVKNYAGIKSCVLFDIYAIESPYNSPAFA
jgi:hypothetical protein